MERLAEFLTEAVNFSGERSSVPTLQRGVLHITLRHPAGTGANFVSCMKTEKPKDEP